MKYPNKYNLSVHPRTDNAEKVADVVLLSVPECHDKGHLMEEIAAKGHIDLGAYYNDIAMSKRFKILQAANKNNLFEMRVTVKELD